MINVLDFLAEFDPGKLPIPPAQGDWVAVRDSMVVHTRGATPTKLLETYRPNEPEDIKKYRLAVYKPITKAPINKAIDSQARILINSNFKIVYSKNIDEYLADTELTPMDTLGVHESFDFFQYIVKKAFRLDFDDPNGVLTWFPVNPDDRRLPAIETNSLTPVDVAPVYVESSG